MRKFEAGKKYFCVSVCDHNVRWEFAVVKRTDKSIWLDNGKRCGIKVYDDYEMIYPLGKYSMCPILKATREVK